MESESVWTAEGAASDLVRLLQQARTLGPQEIRDQTGIYVLKVMEDHSKEGVAKGLLKLRQRTSNPEA